MTGEGSGKEMGHRDEIDYLSVAALHALRGTSTS